MIKALVEEIDVVHVDCSPVLPVTDVPVLIRLPDSTVVVVHSRSAAGKAARRSLHILGNVSAPVPGNVFNVVPTDAGGDGYSYGQTYQPESPRRMVFGRTPTPTRP